MRVIRRRLERLERLSRPPVRFLTLGDLVSASMGEPLAEGRVWGGPLAEVWERQFGRERSPETARAAVR